MTPSDIIGWYSRWPSWAKVLGFLLFAVLLALVLVWWFLRGRDSVEDRAGALAVEHLEDLAEDGRERAESELVEIEKARELERERREALDEAARERAGEAEADHAAIDSACDVAGVDAVLERRRE